MWSATEKNQRGGSIRFSARGVDISVDGKAHHRNYRAEPTLAHGPHHHCAGGCRRRQCWTCCRMWLWPRLSAAAPSFHSRPHTAHRSGPPNNWRARCARLVFFDRNGPQHPARSVHHTKCLSTPPRSTANLQPVHIFVALPWRCVLPGVRSRVSGGVDARGPRSSR